MPVFYSWISQVGSCNNVQNKMAS